MTDRPLYALDCAAALARLAAEPDGLNTAEAQRRLVRYGPNRLPQPGSATIAAVVLHQFQSPFIYLLIAAAVLAVALDHMTDAVFIVVVLTVNATVGGIQEWRAESRARALRSLVGGKTRVRRDGHLQETDIQTLVPGDVVELESGMKVPADLRLIDASDLVVDESTLTGESFPVEKDVDVVAIPDNGADVPLGDRSCMAFAGTLLRSGRAVGVVAATGSNTEIGRIAVAIGGSAVSPPLVARMGVFTRQVGAAALVLSCVIVAVQLLRGNEVGEVLLLALALLVSAIPEGLPVAMTVALSISAYRMSQRNVIVRRLPAVEGLGACTLIATDKTGTLTVNRLSVETVWLPGMGRLQPQNEAARHLALAAAHCSESHGPHAIDHRGEEIGDAVDLAFLRMAGRFDYNAALTAANNRGRISYEPELKYAASFQSDSEVLIAYIKGAPETILDFCGATNWDSGRRSEAEDAVKRLAADGYRVIAVAAGPVTEPEAESLDGLTLLGFAGLIDPLRDGAAAAVKSATAAGIRVVMVTGDHPLTAWAIARELDMVSQELPVDSGQVVTGAQLRALRDDTAAFDSVIGQARVFARTEPLQKLAIVQSLRRQGHVVAVTGDGVNDAPALKAADLGVAMGRSGTDVAREAADLILVDDNFGSIVAGIEEGRAAYANLRKVILLCVSTGAAEIMLVLLATLSGLPPPLTAVQLLWLNLVTNGIQDVALAFERAETGLLRQRPRPKNTGIFDRPMIEQMVLSGATIGLIAFIGFSIAHTVFALPLAAAQGLTLWLLVWCENVHVMNCRSETTSAFRVPLAANPLLIFGVIAAQALQFLAASLPVIGPALRLEAVHFDDAMLLAIPAVLLLAVMEGYKVLRHR